MKHGLVNMTPCTFRDAIVGQVLDELGLQLTDELSGMKIVYNTHRIIVFHS